MPTIKVRHIVSYSSQDPKNPVENLLCGDSSKRWLSAPGDKTGQLQAEFQLDRACVVSHLDIGAFFAFNVRVSVGRSSWPQGQEYTDFLLPTTLMNPADCRQGKNKVTIMMFKQDNFCAASRSEKWDRIRVSCTQPFRRDVQFGLSVFRIMTDEDKPVDPQNAIDKTLLGSPSRLLTSKTPNAKTSEDSNASATLGDIHRHFFKDTPVRQSKDEQLRNKLIKIETGSENFTDADSALSRNIKLVMAAAASRTPQYKASPASGDAASRTPQYKASPASGDAASRSPQYKASPASGGGQETGISLKAKQKKLTFSEEIKRFLGVYDMKSIDPENFTFADLRHKFEKQKCRKLSKEERKEFFDKSQAFVKQLFGADSREESEDVRDEDLSCRLTEGGNRRPITSATKGEPSTETSRIDVSDPFPHRSIVVDVEGITRKRNSTKKSRKRPQADAEDGTPPNKRINNCSDKGGSNTSSFFWGSSDIPRQSQTPDGITSHLSSSAAMPHVTPKRARQVSTPKVKGPNSATKTPRISKSSENNDDVTTPSTNKKGPNSTAKTPRRSKSSENNDDVTTPSTNKKGPNSTAKTPRRSKSSGNNAGVTTPSTNDKWLNKNAALGSPPDSLAVVRGTDGCTPRTNKAKRKRSSSSSGAAKAGSKRLSDLPDGNYRRYKLPSGTELSPSVKPSPASASLTDTGTVMCPLCCGFFPPRHIEIHAAACGLGLSDDDDDDNNGDVYVTHASSGAGHASSSADREPPDRSSQERRQCPLCYRSFPASDLEIHAERCLDGTDLAQFGDGYVH